MSPIDRESLFFKLGKIRSTLRTLKMLGALPYREYTGDIEHRMTAERLLHVGIEAMLDVGNHIIAVEGLQAPLEYRDVFSILGKAKILPSHLVDRCQRMVGLRNRLVHEYTEIDHKRIHEILKHDLNDFGDYVRAILRFTRKQK